MALEAAGGNRTQAARLLKMSFRSFRYRLAKFDLAEGE
jgi:two-component system response regulator PilR (NtrC family)